MSEQAPPPQPTPDQMQLPGQGKLFSERQMLWEDRQGELRLGQLRMDYNENHLGNYNGPLPTKQEVAASTPPAVETAMDQAVAPQVPQFESRLARFFGKSAEITEKGMEKYRRFRDFLGRTALRGQLFVGRVREKGSEIRENWRAGGDTRTKQLGSLAVRGRGHAGRASRFVGRKTATGAHELRSYTAGLAKEYIDEKMAKKWASRRVPHPLEIEAAHQEALEEAA